MTTTDLRKALTQNQLGIRASRKDGEPGTTFIRVCVGQIIELAPHCDLWVRGAHTAEIRRIYNEGQILLRIRPILDYTPLKQLYTIRPEHVLA